MTPRFETEKARLGRDWTDYSVLPLESNWYCVVMSPEEKETEAVIVFSTEDMQFHVENFLSDISQAKNVIYCKPISDEAADQIIKLGMGGDE